jgi:hypothetical protein
LREKEKGRDERRKIRGKEKGRKGRNGWRIREQKT